MTGRDGTQTDDRCGAKRWLFAVAPRLAKAQEQERTEAMRGISRCVHNYGSFHAYGAGPCFDTLAQAQRYRDEYDATKGDPTAMFILRRRYGQA